LQVRLKLISYKNYQLWFYMSKGNEQSGHVCGTIFQNVRMAFVILETLALGDYQANCYIYASETGRRGLIIDPGDEPDEILKRIKDLNLYIEYIVLTHGHPDHTGALKRVREATGALVAMHSADVAILNDKFLYSLLGFHLSDIMPNRLLADGETIGAGELSLKVLHTPGHTPGGICLLGAGFVFTGDTLFNMSVGRTDLPGGNMEALMSSINDKLMTLPDEMIIYPGHGPASTIGNERRSNPFLTGDFRSG
jgi:hydroxyacylglutathione hydrolase